MYVAESSRRRQNWLVPAGWRLCGRACQTQDFCM